jgi:hypothetical protein
MAARKTPLGSSNPAARWEEAMRSLYPTSPAAREKGCPRGAFLGLCEEGLIKDIPAGDYTASKEDKAYAVHAATLLAGDNENWSISTLWQAVANNPEKTHSNQMDIVLALWNNGLILPKP